MITEQIAYVLSKDLNTQNKYEIEITQNRYDNLPPSDYEITVKGATAEDKIILITDRLSEAERAMKYLHEKIMTGNIYDLLLINQKDDLMGKINYEMFGY